METSPATLSKLREPFPAHHISKLPKESKAQADARKANRNEGISCSICGGWHHRNAVHLDYVGHAALTDRLLDTDMQWSWEPAAWGPDGLPAFDRTGGLWIKLTVQGVTRLGYGAADGKTGGDAVKEIIGDALRNAAMRFGAALDLWHKGDLHLEQPPEQPTIVAEHEPGTDRKRPAAREKMADTPGPMKTVAEARVKYGEIVRELNGCEDESMLDAYLNTEKPFLDQFKARGGLLWEGDRNEVKGLANEIAEARERVAEAANG